MLQQWSVFYAHGLQYRDGSDGLGIGTTSLSVGLRFSLEYALQSGPNYSLRKGLVGLIKARSLSTSINQPNKHMQHAMQF